MLIEAVPADCLEEKGHWWKGFFWVSGYKLIKNLMERHGKVTESIKRLKKEEFVEAYDPRLVILQYFWIIKDAIKLANKIKTPWQPE